MNIIEKYLEKSNTTKYRLSKESGIPYSTVSDICSGRTPLNKCSAETVYRLSRATGMSCDEIISSVCERKTLAYVSGTYALNLTSPDGTPGDWHYSAINWDNIRMSYMDESIYGSWGIYEGSVPGHGKMYVADHVRACLDLIEQGYFSSAGGMRNNFISDERYTKQIFDKVWLLKDKENWCDIDRFMGKEYLCDWIRYKEETA